MNVLRDRIITAADVARLAIIAAVYYLTAHLGLLLAFEGTVATPIWPPTGIALALVLTMGYRIWPAVFVGALLVNLTTLESIHYLPLTSFLAAFVIAIGNTLEAVLGAWMLKRFSRDGRPLDTVRGVAGLIVFGAVLAPVVSATIGVTTSCVTMHSLANYGIIWFTWWLGDSMSVLIVTPLFLSWPERMRARLSLKSVAGTTVLLGCSAAYIFLILTSGFKPYLLIPPVLLAAVIAGRFETAAVVVLVASIMTLFTHAGGDPFASGSVDTSLDQLVLFNGVVAVVGMFLSTVIVELREAEARVREAGEYVRNLINNSPVPMAVSSSVDGRLEMLNTLFTETYGYTLDDIPTIQDWWPQAYPEEADQHDAESRWTTLHEAALRERRDCGPMETVIVTKDGQTKHVEFRLSIHSTRCIVTALDITERKLADLERRESEARYRSVVDAAGVGITMISRQMEVLSANKQFRKWFPQVEISGRPLCFKTVNNPPRDQICCYCPVVKTFEDGQVHEAITETPSGDAIRNFRVVSSPVFDARGSVTAAIEIVEDITEKVRSDEVFRSMSNELKTIYDNTYTMFAYLDRDFNFIRVNRAYARAGAQEPEYFVGKNHFVLYPYTDNQVIFQRVVDTGDPYVAYAKPFEYADHPEWGITYWDWTLVPVKDADGHVTGLVLSLLDVTKRRRAEERATRLAAIVESSDDAIIGTTPDGLVTSWNKAAEKIYGYSESEMLGQSVAILVPPERKDEYLSTLESLRRGVHIERFETERRRKNGQLVSVSLTISPVHDSSGAIVGASTIARNITATKAMAEALRNSEEKFVKAFRSSPIALTLARVTDGILVEANTAFEKMTGYSVSEALGKSSLELNLFPDRGERTVDTLQRVRQMHNLEIHLRCKSGELRTVLCSAQILTLGNIEYILCSTEDITERKRTEEALRAASSYMRNLIEVSLDPLVTISPDGKIMDVNKATELATGVNRDRLIGRDFCDSFTEPDEARRGYQRVLAQGWVTDYPLSIRHSSGRSIDVLYNAAVYRNESGELQGVFAAARDVTERKRAEDALVASEQKFRSLFEESLDCLFVTLPHGTILDMNKKGIALFGYDSKEQVQALDLVRDVYANPDDRKWVLEIVAIDGHAEYDVELKRKNGTRFTGHCLLYAVRDQSGVITSYRGSLRDVTDKKRAEEDLRLAKEDWERTFDAVEDLIFIQDLGGTVRRVNRAMCRQFGKSAEELVGMRCCDLMHDTSLPPEYCPRALMFTDGTSHACEIAESHLGGTFMMSVSPIRDSGGNVIGSVHVARDITETRRLQELESRAQRLDTAGRIAGQVAHDLNNLLAPITAYPELIRELLPPDDPTHGYLNAIESAGSRIAEINQQLLTLSRRGHYNLSVIALNELVIQAIDDLGEVPEEIIFSTELQQDLMNIMGGSAQIHRVLLNLLTNARDAITGHGTISVKTEDIYVDEVTINYERVPKGEYVKITVSDTGSGIPSEIVQKIFEPFFTTKSTDQKRGSGLGLSVVAAVVRDHAGYIDLATEVGKGTSFYLYFPITRESQPGSETYDDAPTGQESILVVDDDDVQRDVLCKLLSTLGYQASSCGSGEEAIEILKAEPRYLLILDMIMPGGMDGVETFRAARQINPGQRAIIVSGFSETDKVREALSLGVGAFIRKPLNRATIAKAVRQELNRVVADELVVHR